MALRRWLAVLALSVALIAAACVSRARAQHTLSPACDDGIKMMFNHTYPHYDMMLDATGKTLLDLGNEWECKQVGADLAHFCVFYLGNVTAPIPVAIGACLPIACDSSDMAAVADYFIALQGLPAKYATINGTCDIFEETMPASSWVAIGFFVVMMLVCVVGSFIDVRCREKPQQPVAIDAVSESNIQSSTPNDDVLLRPRRRSKIATCCFKAITAFSLPRNFASLSRVSVGELSALNGLRVFSMVLIIFGHTAEFYSQFSDNLVFMRDFVQTKFLYQILPDGYYAVDTFFYMSGFLVAHSLIPALRKRGKRCFPVHLFYLHRLLRLWPLYLFILLMYIKVSVWIGTGFIWQHYRDYVLERCNQYWWTNLAFVNNFWPTDWKHMCLGWSWYLANDFQFYLISPLICWVYYKKPVAGFALASLFLVGTWTTIATLMWYYQLPGNPTLGYEENFMNTIYGKPYGRAAPFFIGIMFAWVYNRWVEKTRARMLEEGKSEKAPLPEPRMRVRIPIYLALTILFVCTCFLLQIQHEWTFMEGLLYNTFGRSAFALGVGLTMHVCFMAPSCWLNKLLGARPWSVLGKLTFGSYLVHPIILFSFYYNRSQIMVFNVSDLFFFGFAALLLSYLLAMALSLLIEKPFMNLEALIFPSRRSKPAPKPVVDDERRHLINVERAS